ncbi:TPA: DUF4935 domain-containing protein [Bacillus cereus]|uniref:PIN domain-containing protein n=1 Tax=Bacillus cereus group TaxID=86661 RepID=UPI0018CDCC3C|nr:MULTISPECIES: PIN domain-containing protein [Bacillus cereus group]HDX9587755.1 DUF4935 domain-containing protein [Bacillus pseudomycoides]HEI9568445.1 DUF4935 domain-containing protein [Bacillus cereus]MBG9840109.1 hypothetical protein [Bacillus tropicus]MBG9875717.1 hypothetical protein [Bacillus tropicus]MBG9919730.1 hypothetical protein [Bacillus tropicus]
MNIFLDSNILFKDPYLEKGLNKTLNRLARHEDVKLFISKVVYMEVLRGHKIFLENEIKSVNTALKRMNPYLDSKKNVFIFNVQIDDLLKDFEDNYNIFQEEQKLKIIDYDADVFAHIVEMDMHEKGPFIKKQEFENKNGDIVRFNKKEVRDAIIWYSYQVFIEKNDLKDCYFISNNTKEFGDTGSNKSPENEPYSLHPEINKSDNIIAYKSVKGFLTHNDEGVKELFTDIHIEILSDDLFEKIEEELEDGFAEELVETFLTEEILVYTQNYLENKQPIDINDAHYMDGHLSPNMDDGYITQVVFNDVEVYGNEITITVDVVVEMDVEIYLYNPVYDNSDEKYQYYGTETVEVEESIVFVLSIDDEKEINEENFSFRKYAEGIEPDNLDIEVIGLKKIRNTSPFPDDVFV